MSALRSYSDNALQTPFRRLDPGDGRFPCPCRRHPDDDVKDGSQSHPYLPQLDRWDIVPAVLLFQRPLVPEAPDLARSQALWENCKRSDQRLRYGFHIAKFRRFLATYDVKNVRRASGVLLQFPPLAEIRAKFLELNPWAEAFTPGNGEWVGPVEFP